MTARPSVSCVVVSHNRKEEVAECVRSITACPAKSVEFEIIVVLDSCSDGSRVCLEAMRGEVPHPLIIDSINARRPAAARNRGAALARGDILIFLDDDVVVATGFLDAHCASQKTADVVTGYLKPAFRGTPDWWQLGARLWWENRFKLMRQPGHTPGYRDLFTANFSVKASLFRSCGGFDEHLGRLEDYELGIRLLKAGARFVHDPGAIAVHRETGNYRRWLKRTNGDASAELHMGTRHPDYRASIFHERLAEPDPGIAHWKTRIRRLAFRRNPVIGLAFRAAELMLPPLERMRARYTWRLLLGAVHEYRYWHTIAARFPTESEFLAWVRQ